MSIYNILPLSTIIICLGIAHIVYQSNKKSLLNKLFTLINLFIVYWVFTDEFMYYQAESVALGLFWVRIGFLRVFAIPLFVHFILVFTEKKRILKNKIIYFLLYLPALFFAVTHLLTNFLAVTSKNIDSSHNPLFTMIFPLFVTWSLLLTVFILIILVHFYFSSTNIKKRNQTKLIFLGLLFSFLIGVVSIIMLHFKIEFPKPISLIITSTNIFIAYSIWKYDLFKLDPIKASEYIIDTMPDSLILVNMEKEIVEVNSRFEHLFGYQEAEITGKPLDILFEEKKQLKRILDNLLAGKNINNKEIELKEKSGRIIPVLFSASLIKTKMRQTIGIVCIATDIAELKFVEKKLLLFNDKLQQSNRELQDFVYIASHDLKEPLRKINTLGSRLKTKSLDTLDAQSNDYIDRMQNAALRMYELIDDLLLYSRVTTNSKPFTATNLSQIINEVLADLELQIEETGGLIEVAELPEINADSTQMRLLFQNLISNALKFHKPGEPPEIMIYPVDNSTGNGCTIIIEDNGIGIAEQDYKEIFGVFKKLHARSEYEGSGIGLTVCKKIVDKHNGTIHIESIVGEGSKFILNLPL